MKREREREKINNILTSKIFVILNHLNEKSIYEF